MKCLWWNRQSSALPIHGKGDWLRRTSSCLCQMLYLYLLTYQKVPFTWCPTTQYGILRWRLRIIIELLSQFCHILFIKHILLWNFLSYIDNLVDILLKPKRSYRDVGASDLDLLCDPDFPFDAVSGIVAWELANSREMTQNVPRLHQGRRKGRTSWLSWMASNSNSELGRCGLFLVKFLWLCLFILLRLTQPDLWVKRLW